MSTQAPKKVKTGFCGFSAPITSHNLNWKILVSKETQLHVFDWHCTNIKLVSTYISRILMWFQSLCFWKKRWSSCVTVSKFTYLIFLWWQRLNRVYFTILLIHEATKCIYFLDNVRTAGTEVFPRHATFWVNTHIVREGGVCWFFFYFVDFFLSSWWMLKIPNSQDCCED